ncbi:MAG: response regulator [Phycisphaerales bacterium]
MTAPSPPPGKPNLKITSAERPNTLGLSQRDLVTLLEKLEAQDKGKAPVRRGFARWPFRHATVWVTLIQPSGTESRLKLACRNLSRGGIALLHNSFMHAGSAVVVTLPRLTGGTRDIPGTIKRCQHKRGTMHELGVQFDEEIDLRDYMGQTSTGDFYSLESVNPEKLQGTMLYCEDNEVDFRIMQHFLRDTQLRLVRVKTGAEALTEATKGCDIIVANWRMKDMQGTEFITRLREQNIDTPALILSPVPVGPQPGWNSHSTGVLVKPLQQTTLLRAIAERVLLSHEDDEGTQSEEGQAATIAGSMAEQFHAIADGLEKSLEANDTTALVESCMQVRGSAPALGLTALSRAAEAAVAACTSGDPAKRNRSVRELIAACRSLPSAA